MPNFDLRHIGVARYNEQDEATYYTDHRMMGEAMTVQLELMFAEGRLYAEGSLSEYIKLATGGTMSVGVKRIPPKTQVLLYGNTESAYTVNGRQMTGLVTSADDLPNDVGVSFYAPDRLNGKNVYTCVFVKRATFGPPSLSYATRGQNISFGTPTTTGEFQSDTNNDFFEVAVAENEIDAVTWCDTMLGMRQAAKPTATPTGGEVTAGTAITLTSTDSGEIRYTIDGRTPTKNSKLYDADNKISINFSCILKARLFNDGMSPSDVMEMEYTVAGN